MYGIKVHIHISHKNYMCYAVYFLENQKHLWKVQGFVTIVYETLYCKCIDGPAER